MLIAVHPSQWSSKLEIIVQIWFVCFLFFTILLHFTTIVKEKVNSFKHLKKLLGERNVISFYHICHNPLLIIARKLKMNKFQSLKISSLLLLLLKRHLDFGLFIVVFFGHSFFNLGIIPKPKKFSTSEFWEKSWNEARSWHCCIEIWSYLM